MAAYYQCENLEYPANFLKPMLVSGEEALYSMFYECYKLRETMPLIGHTFTGSRVCYMMYNKSYKNIEICRQISLKQTEYRPFTNYLNNLSGNNYQNLSYMEPETKLRIIEDIKIQNMNGDATFIQAFAGHNNLVKTPTITIDNVGNNSEAFLAYTFTWCKGLTEGCKFTKKFPMKYEDMKETYSGDENITKIWIPTSTDLSAEDCVKGLFVSVEGFGRVANVGTVYLKAGVTIPSNANKPDSWEVVND